MPTQRKPFQTVVRKLAEPLNGTCYPCGQPGQHTFWDPESNGLICESCLPEYMAAERVLLSVRGICRPAPNHEPK
jgi:recombinational DNA repair protein (RecF pathway)